MCSFLCLFLIISTCNQLCSDYFKSAPTKFVAVSDVLTHIDSVGKTYSSLLARCLSANLSSVALETAVSRIRVTVRACGTRLVAREVLHQIIRSGAAAPPAIISLDFSNMRSPVTSVSTRSPATAATGSAYSPRGLLESYSQSHGPGNVPVSFTALRDLLLADPGSRISSSKATLVRRGLAQILDAVTTAEIDSIRELWIRIVIDWVVTSVHRLGCGRHDEMIISSAIADRPNNSGIITGSIDITLLNMLMDMLRTVRRVSSIELHHGDMFRLASEFAFLSVVATLPKLLIDRLCKAAAVSLAMFMDACADGMSPCGKVAIVAKERLLDFIYVRKAMRSGCIAVNGFTAHVGS